MIGRNWASSPPRKHICLIVPIFLGPDSSLDTKSIWYLTYGWLRDFCLAPWFGQICIWPVRSCTTTHCTFSTYLTKSRMTPYSAVKYMSCENGLGNKHIDSFRSLLPPRPHSVLSLSSENAVCYVIESYIAVWFVLVAPQMSEGKDLSD